MSKYYTTKYMETETIFRCYTSDILRFCDAFCGDSSGILFDIYDGSFIEITWNIDFSVLSSLFPLQDALKGGDSQNGLPML